MVEWSRLVELERQVVLAIGVGSALGCRTDEDMDSCGVGLVMDLSAGLGDFD